MRKIICGGTVVTEQGTFPGNVLIENGKILKVTGVSDEPAEADEVVDATEKYVLPGAACGGTTTIVDHMAFGPKGCSPWHQVKEYHRLADGNTVVDYGFHGVLQHVDDQVLEDMAQIAKEEGITSFKIYMTYDFRLDDLDLMKIMQKAAKEGILIASHCENHGIVTYWRERFAREKKTQTKWHPVSRPAEAEAEAVSRLLYLAKAAEEAPVYIVHLSSREGLEEVRKAGDPLCS